METETISKDHLEQDMKDLEQKAKRRAREKGAFIGHIFIYFIVNFFLVIINLITDKENLWARWIVIGWGIGLFVHFISTYIIDGIVAGYVDRQTEKEMEKIKK